MDIKTNGDNSPATKIKIKYLKKISKYFDFIKRKIKRGLNN